MSVCACVVPCFIHNSSHNETDAYVLYYMSRWGGTHTYYVSSFTLFPCDFHTLVMIKTSVDTNLFLLSSTSSSLPSNSVLSTTNPVPTSWQMSTALLFRLWTRPDIHMHYKTAVTNTCFTVKLTLLYTDHGKGNLFFLIVMYVCVYLP